MTARATSRGLDRAAAGAGVVPLSIAAAPTARPPRPADLKYREPSRGRLDPVRLRVKRALAYASDRRWLGLTPFQTHVVICGFPRSGSTLLLLMAETAYPEAKTYREEKTGIKAARELWAGRTALMITKRPNDVFFVDEIREFYRSRRAHARFVLCARDPRAVLTSVHNSQEGYYVSPERWRAMYAHIVYVRHAPDVLTVEFNDLVREPARVQAALGAFIGWDASVPFDQFHASVPRGFDTLALNGVRPLDPSTIDKWRAPVHRERIRAMLSALPELPEVLIREGYEPDDAWLSAYA
jgi:hypothetical protein